jgi:DNA adenine methylase
MIQTKPARRRITPAIKVHGGKHYLASRIVELMPPHLTYLEPYCGGCQVLFAHDPEGTSEIINDLDGKLIGFWRVLADVELFAEFQRIVQAIPMSRAEWQDAHDYAEWGADKIADAVNFFILARQSLAGRMDTFTGVSKTRTRRGMNEQCAAWLSAVDGLPEVHERLRRVLIENKPALELIADYDRPDVLIYCDPPYLPSTRTAENVYAHEMSLEDHRELLDVLVRTKAKVIASGYPSKLYGQTLAGWRKEEHVQANHAAGGDTKRKMTEVLWLNFPAP